MTQALTTVLLYQHTMSEHSLPPQGQRCLRWLGLGRVCGGPRRMVDGGGEPQDAAAGGQRRRRREDAKLDKEGQAGKDGREAGTTHQ